MDICLATRVHNGGLINLQELCHLLRQRRKSDRGVVSEDDCLRAISKLKVVAHKLDLTITFHEFDVDDVCFNEEILNKCQRQSEINVFKFSVSVIPYVWASAQFSM